MGDTDDYAYGMVVMIKRHDNKVDGRVGIVQSHEGQREWGILMMMHI